MPIQKQTSAIPTRGSFFEVGLQRARAL